MIKYTTKNGAKVEIQLEGKLVTDLTVNGIKVVENNTDSNVVFISTFNNTIVLNSSRAYKKLGSESVVRIATNDEVISVFKSAVEKSIKKSNEEAEKIINLAKENNKKKGISEEQFALTFDKHMTK